MIPQTSSSSLPGTLQMQYSSPSPLLSETEPSSPIVAEVVVLCYQLGPGDINSALQRFQKSTPGLDLRWLVYDNTKSNLNIHHVWNQLLASCQAKYWVNLSPDTQPHRGWLGRIIDVMEANPRLAVCGPSTDNTYNEQRARDPKALELVPPGSWVPGTYPSGFACVYRTEVLKGLGGFREDFDFYGGDLDMCYRMASAGWLSGWCIKSFVGHTWGKDAKQRADYGELRAKGNTQLSDALTLYYSNPGTWIHSQGKVERESS